LPGFTGIDSDYEPPKYPDLVINAGEESEVECMQKLVRFLEQKGIIPEEVFDLNFLFIALYYFRLSSEFLSLQFESYSSSILNKKQLLKIRHKTRLQLICH
jgi:hypothetical protein